MVEKRVKKFGQGPPPPFSGNARKKLIFLCDVFPPYGEPDHKIFKPSSYFFTESQHYPFFFFFKPNQTKPNHRFQMSSPQNDDKPDWLFKNLRLQIFR